MSNVIIFLFLGTTTAEEPSTTETTATTTIEEKPIISKGQLEALPIDISPSKPVNLPNDSQIEEIFTTPDEPLTTTKEVTSAEPTTTSTTTTTKEPPTTKNVVKKLEQEKKATGAPVTTKKTTAKPTTPIPPKPVENAKKETVISSKVTVLSGSKVVENIVSKVDVIEDSTPEPSKVTEKLIFSKVEVISGEPVEEVAVNNLQPTPEYDYLSRQPSEVVDETFKVIDLKPSVSRHSSNQKNRGPDGKVRAFNSVANFNTDEESITTNKAPKKVAVKILPSSSGIRILKTAAPKSSTRSPNVEPTPVSSGLDDESLESLVVSQPNSVLVRQSRRPAIGGGFGKNKSTPKSKVTKESDDYSTTDEDQNDFTSPQQSEPTTPSYRKGSKFSSKGTTTTTQRVPSFKQNRFYRPTTAEPETDTTEGVATQRRFQPSAKRYDSNNNGATSAAVVTPANRRTFKKHFQQQEQQQQSYQQQSSPQPVPTAPLTFKSKLIRPTGRWEYKTSPKPRVTIRRIDDIRHNQENATTPLTPHFHPDVQVDSGDQALAGSGLLPALQHDDDNDVLIQDVTPTASAETIRVEISTPAEFKDVYYEIATIKSPYSFQVNN
jgi:hypothetical protein